MTESVASPVSASPLGGREQASALSGPEGKGRVGRSVPWVTTWILLISLSSLVASAMVVVLHGEHGFFVPVLATAICILAALFDAWTTQIPNPLTYTAILVGILVNLFASAAASMHWATAERWLAAPGAQQSLLGFGVCAVLGIVGLIVARVGGGDIKLLAGLGAIVGLSNVGTILIAGLSVALVYSLVNLAVSGRLNAVVRIGSMRCLEVVYFRRLDLTMSDATTPDGDRQARDTIPMAVPLAIGLVISQAINLKQLLLGAGV